MRTGRNGSHATLRDGGEQLQVFAGQHLQLSLGDQRECLACVAAAVLDGLYARMGSQVQQSLAFKFDAGTVWDVVDDERHLGSVGECLEPVH